MTKSSAAPSGDRRFKLSVPPVLGTSLIRIIPVPPLLRVSESCR